MTDTSSTPAGTPAPAPKASEASAAGTAAKIEEVGAKAEGFFAHQFSKMKHNFKWEQGNKGMFFARGAAVTAGVGMTLHSLKSKDAAGEDRSAAIRLTEGVLGLGLAAGGALAFSR